MHNPAGTAKLALLGKTSCTALVMTSVALPNAPVINSSPFIRQTFSPADTLASSLLKWEVVPYARVCKDHSAAFFFKINSSPRLHSTINFFLTTPPRPRVTNSNWLYCLYWFTYDVSGWKWDDFNRVLRWGWRLLSLQVGPYSPHCIFFSYPSTYGEASKDNISFNSLVYGFSFHIHWYNRYTLKIWSIHFSILLYVLTNLSLLFWNWKGLEETWCGCSSVKKSVAQTNNPNNQPREITHIINIASEHSPQI